MWRFLLVGFVCLPLLLQAYVESTPLWSERPPVTRPEDLDAETVKTSCPRSRQLLACRQVVRMALAPAVRSSEKRPDAGPAEFHELEEPARLLARDLWKALEFVAAFRDEGNDKGEFVSNDDLFKDDPILWNELQDARKEAKEAAKDLTPLVVRYAWGRALSPLIRSWLSKCKDGSGGLLPFGPEAKNEARKIRDELDGLLRQHGGDNRPTNRARRLRDGWDRICRLIKELEGDASAVRQLELLAAVVDMLPALRLEDRHDVRTIARRLYQPLLPEELPLDGEVLLIAQGYEKPERAERTRVFIVVDGRKVRLGPNKKDPTEPDEFTLNSDPDWQKAKKTFAVAGGTSGYVAVRPTPISAAARLYLEKRRRLGKTDWTPAALEALRGECKDHLDNLGAVGKNLNVLIELARKHPHLFDPAALPM